LQHSVIFVSFQRLPAHHSVVYLSVCISANDMRCHLAGMLVLLVSQALQLLLCVVKLL